jgi:hypothetical protein
MEHYSKTYLTLIRDMSLSIAISILLPFIAYWTAQVIRPTRRIVDIPCHYEGISCEVLRKNIQDLHERLMGLRALKKTLPSTPENAQQSRKVEHDIAELESQTKVITMKLEQARDAQQKSKDKALVKPSMVRLYTAIVVGLLALLTSFFVPILPLEIGFIMGGIFTLATGLMGSWFILGDVVKLIALLLAFAAVIAISIKLYTKRRY